MAVVVNSAMCLQLHLQEEIAVQKSTGASAQVDIWASITAPAAAAAAVAVIDFAPPSTKPLRRSSSTLSQKSLEICTESLGSETGSDDFSGDWLSETEEHSVDDETPGVVAAGADERRRKKLEVVNYHCSSNWSSTPRLFPPPLPSISRRDGPCVQMRQQRKNGRLVVQAVPAPSQNYLHCQRGAGRLVLSFIETTFEEIYPEIENPVVAKQIQAMEYDEEEVVEEEDDEEEEQVVEEEEEEEVEVVERGNVVEVKVSSLPQQQSGGMKKHKSSLVINKFVGGTPEDNQSPPSNLDVPPVPAAPAAPAAMSMEEVECWGIAGKDNTTISSNNNNNNKLLFSSKKMMNREALLHEVRRCSEYNRPLLFFEPCCTVATSS